MRTLKSTILEAVSHGRHKTVRLPDSNREPESKEDIISWLEVHGYKLVKTLNDADRALRNFKEYNGDDCYALGIYDPKHPVTHWIRILKGDTFMFIRTCNEDESREKNLTTNSTMYHRTDTNIYRYTDWQTIKNILES